MKEIWKDIKDYEGLYQVSNFGRVRSLNHYIKQKNNSKKLYKGQILKPHSNHSGNGYYIIGLFKNNKRKSFLVHRLVAEAFIDNPENKPEVNHKDGITINNSVDNLEWATRREQMIHAYKHGLQIPAQLGKFNWDSFTGHPVRQLDIKTGKVIKEYGSMEEAARQLNIKSPSNIRGCIIGRQKSCAGYKWEYIK